MSASPVSPSPSLAPPGAGIPAFELGWVRPVFGLVRWLCSDAWATARFEREAKHLLARVAALPIEHATRPVLIPRVAGIEDSSRFWSACMVLEHLRIVNATIVEIIETLGEGRTFAHEIRTADVKPAPTIGRAVMAGFEAGVRDYVDRTAPALRRRTAMKHPHPWFGPLDAHGWHCLAAVHHTLHRRQLSAIVARLPTLPRAAAHR